MAARKTKTKAKSKKAGSRAASEKPKKKAPPKPATRKLAPKKKAKKTTPSHTTPKKLKRGAPTRPAKKKTAARKPAAVERVTTFQEKVENCDAGTGVWFTVAGGVEHAVLQRRGSEGAVEILTDAGVTEVVPSSNLFETADEARAARQG
jgi:hypothetical protein